MKISKLLRFLLRGYLLRVVDDELVDPVDEEDDQDGAGGDGEKPKPSDDDQVDGEVDDEGEGDGGEEGEMTVSLGDESAEQEEEARRAAPEWVRDLRKQKRDMARTIRQRDEEIARLKGAGSQPAMPVLGDKPTLESCDFEPEKFEKDLEAWHERKRQVDDQKRTKDEAETRDRETWQRTQDAYATAKNALKVGNFDDAEGAVEETLNATQRGIMLVALQPKQAALMVYALGNNPKKLAELAAIADPVKFTFAVAKLEAQLKVTKSKTAPAPERVPRGSVASGGAIDNQLERLRKDARESGDYSKVAAHRRMQDQKQRKRA